MTGSDSLDSFVDKWRARWPEWVALLVFVPAAQRPAAAAWFSLLQELRDAAWSGSDPAPGLAKLAWWQEELRGWAKGARRHPLGEALAPLQAPWDALGGALSVLPATRAPGSGDDDTAALEAFAGSLLACEAALFGGTDPQPSQIAGATAGLRAERALSQGDREAAAGLRRLLDASTAAPTRPRRLQQVVVRERLRLLAAGAAPSRRTPLRLLFAAWRAARGG
ncbi:phytoene/squalene synthase family protein [Luteimonas marina]|uniref:Phytoene/squalene synthase family protein n=1 Tax=Luteimonas marina TaxID=488485 RepID=A0A5C5UBX5_9GAMM|nr:phytoene/squalene synthase family protein [Luteimonas marina]TWT23337.1 phytoene/squalene synthase family protein [Luteimonas marina]